ncbi:MAG: YHS domain-containing (seleno)protein [Proteobacteria bacterium]|nr:YHS domain-containing (seleno)protein [Pseudomonadota bacterium]
MRFILRWAFLAALVAAAAGCASRNVVSEGGDSNLMLRGNDPVAYQTEGKALPGNPAIKAEHDGVTYRFTSESNRRLFLASPARYVPAYAGYCASGVHYGLKAAIGAGTFKVVDGRLFLFGGPRSRRNWELHQADNIRNGDAMWEDIKDAPHRLQNLYRYAFKVPGYKTDAELDAEWARRNK